jgi:hypothetical protein
VGSRAAPRAAGRRTSVGISATEGHVVPTAITYHGHFFVGNLGLFPIGEGASKIWKVTPSGELPEWARGFTTILGLTVDQQRRFYVLENTTGNAFPTPNTGRIVRLDPSGTRTVIADGLFLPTVMTFGPDGNLYVSNKGFGPPPIGLGEVVKVVVP